ncbi:MAG: Na+/H+ antiporter NhaC [Bacillota bacterium]|nr:Na+/H+ antiporter NhaC [Bacillota bacterium]
MTDETHVTEPEKIPQLDTIEVDAPVTTSGGEDKKIKTPRLPSVFEALLPIIVLLGIMIVNYVLEWGQDPHIPVLIAVAVAMIIGFFCGHSYKELLAGIVSALSRTMEAILILFCIGLLIGSWLWSGTIPAIVFYGLDLLSPKVFLPVGACICAVVGMACGSSWTTTGTIGIAMMGIGAGMGINPALTAGMCISGAYMGDKFSPLSDTTNLAAAAAQTGLFDHVRAMASTTFPCFVIALIIYAVMGLNAAGNYDPSAAAELQATLAANFNLSLWLLLPVVLIIVVCALKMPALPAILLAVLFGLFFAVVSQGASLNDCITACHYGFSIETGNALADDLLNRGGMDGTLWTINLVIVAISFGGVLEKIGCIEALIGKLIRKIKSVGSLVTTTILTSLFCDLTMCDQYLAIIIPGQMFQKYFDKQGLARNMLSRTLEDCGTLWSPLVPWNSCGAYQSSVLGMSPLAYLPYAFMNLINPIYAIVTACLGRNILYADGTRAGLFSKKLKQGAVAAAPADAHQEALKALAAIRGEKE